MDQNTHKNKDKEKKKKERYGFGAASLMVGIISLTACLAYGSVVGLVGLALGIISILRKEDKRPVAIGGIITSAIGFAIGMSLILMVYLGYEELEDKGIDVYEVQSTQEALLSDELQLS